MAEEWFVRVLGKEYGPVDLDTLEEWKAEGRLIPENEVRAEEALEWQPAGEVPGLFGPPASRLVEGREVFRHRSLGGIITETFRIYFRGLPIFVLLALLTAVPSFVLRSTLQLPDVAHGEPLSAIKGWIPAIPALIAFILAWPVFLGGLQFAALDLAEGGRLRFVDVFRRALKLWPRLARLSFFVYGNYLFWTILPLAGVLLLAGSPSAISFLVATFALAVQVFMAGRLFINFMFWQQSSTIANLEGIDALRESQELARSRKTEPALQRPIYRGAILASLWLVLLLVVSVAVEMPFLVAHLQGVTTLDDAIAVSQKLAQAPLLDVLSSLVHAFLRPLLGIAFVVLYFDIKAER